jgi:putative Ca2+/H+ antiporter (TMEM165/GDT1 family)
MDLKLLLTTMGLLFISELGDKTQLAVLTLVARHKEPWPIFIGASLGLVLVTAVAVVVGQGIGQVVPEETMRRIAAVLFVIMGALIWFKVL